MRPAPTVLGPPALGPVFDELPTLVHAIFQIQMPWLLKVRGIIENACFSRYDLFVILPNLALPNSNTLYHLYALFTPL